MDIARITFLILLLALVLVPNIPGQTTGKNPVIIIPGLTGSELVNPKTGNTVWFSTDRDKDDDLRLPITSPVLSRNRDSLVVRDIIREVKIKVLPDVEVYQSLIDELIAKGYTEADWKNPKAHDVFYVFAYDWRKDNVETARLLMQRMESVKRSVRQPGLKFDIIAHSMGGLIARYAAMYGSADLPAPNRKIVPTWAGAVHINKLMMFGTPNQGSFSAFDALLNGYPVVADRKLPLIDDLRAEDVFATPSAFQLLPHSRSARFMDENLKPLQIDIYDPANWFKYGWGAINDPKFLSKLKDAPRLARTNKEIEPVKPDKIKSRDDLLISRTTFAQARAYFDSVLNRAKRFNAALDAPSSTTPVQLFAYGGNCDETLDAAIIMRDEKKGRWVTLLDARDIKTPGGTEIKKDEVKSVMFAMGDGRVTVGSLLAEYSEAPNAGKQTLPVKAQFLSCGTHTKLFLQKPIQDSFFSALVVETQQQP